MPSTYTIKPGDTFSSLASRFYGKETYWLAIEAANPDVKPNRMKPGDVIKLPARDTVVAANGSTDGADANSDVTETVTATATSSGVHVVQPGDTLSSIAHTHYGRSSLWRVIFEANASALNNNPNRLRTGQKLTIPPKPTDAE